MTTTQDQIVEQLEAHGVEFGKRYRDPASGFEGVPSGLYFFKHGCLRVALRGTNKTTGEPAEFTFDAPELVEVIPLPAPPVATPVTETTKPVPAGKRTGGPHDLAPVDRPGQR